MTRALVGLVLGLSAGLGGGCAGAPDLTDPPGEAQADADAGPDLPPDAGRWASVGTFALRDAGQEVEVRVYAADSDLSGGYMWPNALTVYAYYRPKGGPWKRAEPWHASRIGWVGVGRAGPGGVDLVFRPKIRIEVPACGRLPDPLPEPPPTFTRTLRLEQGVPRIKE